MNQQPQLKKTTTHINIYTKCKQFFQFYEVLYIRVYYILPYLLRVADGCCTDEATRR